MIEYLWRDELSVSFGKVKRPVAQIHIKDKSKTWRAITMYVDSGADVCIVKRGHGELFGHDVAKGRKIALKGIGDQEIIAFVHKMDLLVGTHELEVEVAIAENDSVPNILGRKTVFDLFEIQFKNLKQCTHFIKR